MGKQGDLPIDMALGLSAETDELADGPLQLHQDRFEFDADSVDRAPGAAGPQRSRIAEPVLGTAKAMSSEAWLARRTSRDVRVALGHDWIELRDVFRSDPRRLGPAVHCALRERSAMSVPPAGRYALVVATGAYRDPTLRQLRSPAADGEGLARVLRDPEKRASTSTSCWTSNTVGWRGDLSDSSPSAGWTTCCCCTSRAMASRTRPGTCIWRPRTPVWTNSARPPFRLGG